MCRNPFDPLAALGGTSPQMTREQWEDLMRAVAQKPIQYIPDPKPEVLSCRHCWHAPRDWQIGTLQIPPARLCCWCGAQEGPAHGPYVPQGGH
jgi:hypothetical protein